MPLPFLNNAITSLPYGTNTSNAVAYTTPYVANGSQPSTSHVLGVANEANNERVRRGTAAITIPAGYFTGRISASRLQTILDAFRVTAPASQAYNGQWQGANSPNGQYQSGTTPIYDGYGNYAGEQPVYSTLPQPEVITYPAVAASNAGTGVDFTNYAGTTIRSAHINNLIYEIAISKSVCTCNCNYCTCNCNYCTCNCNYACTCNCNYSDEQVKTEIEYM